MIKKTLTLLGLVATTFALQSCFDKDYDLDNIDKTVSVNTDLTVRVGSLDTIRLRNVMDLEPDGVVQFVKDPNSTNPKDRIFAVIQNGSADIDPINIQAIKIDINNLQPFAAVVSINPKTSAPAKAPRKISGLPIAIPDQEFTYTAKANEAKVDFNQTGNVPCDVRELKKVTLKNSVATVDLTIKNVPQWIKFGYMDDISLSIPKGMKIASAQLTTGGVTTSAVSINGNKIQLTKTKGEGGYKVKRNSAGDLAVKFEITLENLETKTLNSTNDITFTPNTNPDLDGVVAANGKFEILGTFRFTLDDDNLDITALNSEISSIGITDPRYAQIAAGDLTCLMNNTINIDGPISFTNNQIEISKMTGKVRHKVAAIEPIKLDDLPDFLQDDDVVLDIKNPAILLKASHELPATVNTGLTLTSNIDGTDHVVKVNNIAVPASTTPTTFYVANESYNTSIFPAEYSSATQLIPTSGKVGDLISKIPDQIQVDVASVELDVTDFDVTGTYDVDIEYEVFAPLYIGEKFNLVYDDEETGWAEDLEDLEDLDLDSLNFSAKAISNMPADIKLTLLPIAEDKSTINQLIVTSIDVKAMANNQDVKFVFKPAPGYTINDVLAGNDKKGVKKLDGVKYKAEIKGNANSNGKAMPEDAYIILNDLRVSIKGNIVYDAN